MVFMKMIWIKRVSLFTAFIFFVAQIPFQAFALNPQENTPVFNLPSELGKIESFKPQQGPLLIHIQSVHGNYQAEKNIQGILQHLKQQYGINKIFLEGSAFRLDAKYLQFYPQDSSVNKQILDKLAQQSLLQGAELFLLENPQAEIYGIENLRTYQESRQVFKQVFQNQESGEKFLQQLKFRMDALARLHFSKNLKEFYQRWVKYEAGQISLSDWMVELKAWAEKFLSIEIDDLDYQIQWPMLLRFFKLQNIEKKFNQRQFELEREEFLKAIQIYRPQFQLDSKIQLNDVMDLIRALPPDFDFKSYPQIKSFLAQSIFQKELQGASLMSEINRLQKMIFQALIQTPKEADILKLYQDTQWLGKLFALELTPEDYEGLLRKQAQLEPQIMLNRIESIHRGEEGVSQFVDPRVSRLFESAFQFYSLVKKRDRELIQNTFREIQKQSMDKAVVITGGFHTEPFRHYFESLGFTYAVISPNMIESDHLTVREKYIRALLQDQNIPQATMSISPRAVSSEQQSLHGDNFDWQQAQIQDIKNSILKSRGTVQEKRDGPQLVKASSPVSARSELRMIFELSLGIGMAGTSALAVYFYLQWRNAIKQLQHSQLELQASRDLEGILDRKMQLFQMFLEAIPDAVFIKSKLGRFEYVNKAFADYIGLEVHKILGRTDAELFPDRPDLVGKYKRDDQYVIESGKTLVEVEPHSSKGRESFVEVRKAPVMIDGETMGIIGIFTDITEKKKAQGAYEDLFDHAPIPFHVLDAEGRIVKVNKAWIETLGFLESEVDEKIIGWEIFDFLLFEQRENARKRFKERMQFGKTQTPKLGDRVYLKKDGSQLVGETSDTILYDEEGKVTGVQTSFLDQTEVKKIEKALQEGAKRFEDITSASPVGIFLADVSPAVGAPPANNFVNNKLEEIFAAKREELINWGWLKFVHEDDAIQVAEKAKEIAVSPKKAEAEFRIKTPAGEVRFISVRITPRFSLNGEFLGQVGIVTDMTEQKMLEQRLQDAQFEIVRMTQGAIIQKVLRDYGKFVHDTKNSYMPLYSIDPEDLKAMQEFYKRLAERDKKNGDEYAASRHEDLLFILDSFILAIESADRMVNRAHGVLKELGAPPKKEILRVSQLIQEAVEGVKLKVKMSRETIHIRTEMSGIDPVINGRQGSLVSVFYNLIDNAVDAMKEVGGEIVIRINAFQTEVGKPAVKIEIEDDGPGISQDNLDRIFEHGFTTKRGQNGSGFGLWYVVAEVEDHGGKIDVTSTVGSGTKFTVILPEIAQDFSPVNDSMSQRKATLSQPAKSSVKILLVDDEEMARRPLIVQLNRMGYQEGKDLFVAADAPQALEIYRKNPDIHIIVSDFYMPGMDGIDFLLEARNLNPEIPVILMTGNGDDVEARAKEVFGQERFMFLRKPFQFSVLKEAMDKLVNTPNRSELRKIVELLDGVSPLVYSGFYQSMILAAQEKNPVTVLSRENYSNQPISPDVFLQDLLEYSKTDQASSEPGRVIIHPDLVAHLMKENPEAFYLLLKTLNDYQGGLGKAMDSPLLVTVGDKDELNSRAKGVLTPAKLGRIKKVELAQTLPVMIQRLNQGKLIEVIKLKDEEGFEKGVSQYVKAHQNEFGVAILAPDVLNAVGDFNLLLNLKDIHPRDYEGLAFVGPVASESARLVHQLVDEGQRRNILAALLNRFLPGAYSQSSNHRTVWILQLTELFQQAAFVEHYLATQA